MVSAKEFIYSLEGNDDRRVSMLLIKRYSWAIWIVGIIIAFVPFVLKNNLYQSVVNTPDIKIHNSSFIRAFTEGTQIENVIYPLQVVVGWILAIANKVLHIDSVVLLALFMTLVLIGSALAIHHLLSRMQGLSKSWLILIIAMFCNTSILALYRYGIVNSIINMYIILPLAIWCVVKWITQRKVGYVIGWLALIALFSFLHPTSIYLRYSMFVMIGGLLIYKLIVRKASIWQYLRLAIIALLINIVVYRYSIVYFSDLDTSIATAIGDTVAGKQIIDFGYISYFLSILTPITIILCILSIGGLIVCHKRLNFSRETKILLWILGSLAITMFAGTIFSAGIPDRVSIDLATMVAMIVGILLVHEIKVMPLQAIVCYSLVAVGTASNLITWVR
jgi:hypothetical protein